MSIIEDLGDDDDVSGFDMCRDKNKGWSGAGPNYYEKVQKALSKNLSKENERLKKDWSNCKTLWRQ